MDSTQIISAFVTLFVVIDPVGLAPLFIALTRGMDPARRRRVGWRAIAIAAGLLIAAAELLAQIGADPEIGVCVLGASTETQGPGPLVSRLLRDVASLPCPLTIVPGDISAERLQQIT